MPSYAEQLGRGASEPVVDMIKEFVEKGQPIPPIPIIIAPPTAGDQILGAIGRVSQLATSSESVNTGVAFLSVRTAGQSALGFINTEDQVAKNFYALGFLFSGTAAGFSSSSVISKACSINRVGILGEAVGEACYQVAQEANKIAIARDKKTVPVRKPIFSKNTGPAAFIFPSDNGTGVYKIIISNLVFIVTAYGYIKIIRTGFKKVKLILVKRQKVKQSKLLNRAAKFLVISTFRACLTKYQNSNTIYYNKSCLFSTI